MNCWWGVCAVTHRCARRIESMKRIQALLIATSLLISAPALAAEAIFAGGCFWCVEALYQETGGVSEVVSGFTGGSHPNPSYSGRHDGHYEAVKVIYDPSVVTYQALLDLYWVNIDPFDDRGQFCDKGPSYRAAIFVGSDEERKRAEASKAKVAAKFPNQKVATEILPKAKFFPVVESHQDYYKKNPIRYRYYRRGCGRDARLTEIWGDRAKH